MCLLLFFSPADGEDSTVSIQIKLENEGSDEELETDMLYSPQLALKLALTEWLGEFGVPHQYNSKYSQKYYRFALCLFFGEANGQCDARYLLLSVRPPGASEWCENHSHRHVIIGRSVSLLIYNSYDGLPAANYVSCDATSLSGSTITSIDKKN